MASINFTGLASGLDTQSIIKAMVDVARQPITQLRDKRSNYSSQLSRLSTLSSRLSSLRSAARALDTASEFQSSRATSSDTGKLTVSASSAAVVGSYAISIESLARAERSYGLTVSAKDQTGLVGTGDLTITIGSSSQTVAVDETTDTLESVAQKLNGLGLDLTASLVNIGSGYRLVVNGTKTGQAAAIGFAETGTLAAKLGLSAAGAEVQAATDARIVLDGNTITSAGNQLSDVIPGVTLNLTGESAPSTVTVTVAVDTDAIAKKVQALVDAYNSVMEFIQSEFSYKGEARSDTLMGDAAVLGVKAQLQRLVASEVATSGVYDRLSEVGITTNRDGSLSLSSSKLAEALSKDLRGVTQLFTLTDNNDATDNDGVALLFGRRLDSQLLTPGGPIAARQSGINSSIRIIDDRIATLERNVATYEEGLVRRFAALEEMMSTLQSQGNFLSQVSASSSQ
jgi:flagellar hook-associated protein 2